MQYFDIFMGFLRSGMLCFGGGPASIPFIHKEVVERYKWMDNEEFAEVVAIANTLPGPINTKLAGYIGYKIGGYAGLMIALIAVVLPTSILMIVLLTVLSHFANEPWARGMTRAMIPVVGVMLSVMCVQFVAVAAKGLGWPLTIVHIVIIAVLVWFVVPHPAIVLLGLFFWALVGQGLFERFMRSFANKKNSETAIISEENDKGDKK